eukprot:UN03350
MVDAEGDCIAVTIYNMAAGKGFNPGDSVAIPEPYVQEAKFKLKEDEVNFDDQFYYSVGSGRLYSRFFYDVTKA